MKGLLGTSTILITLMHLTFLCWWPPYRDWKRVKTSMCLFTTSQLMPGNLIWYVIDDTVSGFQPVCCSCCCFFCFCFCFFLNRMSIIWIDLCNESCVFIQPPVHPSCVAKTWMLDITCKLFDQIASYLPYLYYRHHWLLPFYTPFNWPWPCLLVRRSAQSKPLGSFFFFLHTFHVIRMKFNMVLKQFKLNIQVLF